MTLHSPPTIINSNPVSNSPSTNVSKPVSFYIQALNYDVLMNLGGALTTSANDLPQCDAECVYNVQVGLLQKVFKVWLDNLSIDFTDASSNARYYVFTENWTAMDMNVANALIDNGAVANVSNSQLMLSKQDFLRYLAQNLFGTYLGTDLFSNEQGILNDIGVQSHNAWITQMNTMNKIAATNVPISCASDPSYSSSSYLQTYSNLQTDTNGKKYLTNSDTTINNITYQLMTMINSTDPGRLAIDFSNQVIGADGLASVPFRAGDALYLYTTMYPASGQELLTGVPVISPRKYALKINIVSNSTSPANIVPLEYSKISLKKYSEYCFGYLISPLPPLIWSCVGGDIQNTRNSKYPGPTMNQTVWKINTASGGYASSTAVVISSNGKIYGTSGDNTSPTYNPPVSFSGGINPDNGLINWVGLTSTYNTTLHQGSSFVSSPVSPAVNDKYVYFTSGNSLYAYLDISSNYYSRNLNYWNGIAKVMFPIWKYTTTNNIWVSPIIDTVNNVIYQGSDDGFLYAINALTGVLIWKYSVGNTRNNCAVDLNGNVYLANSSYIYSINSSGTLNWRITGYGSIANMGGPTYNVKNNTLIVPYSSGGVVTLNASTGAVIWNKTNINSSNAGSKGIALANNKIYTCSGIYDLSGILLNAYDYLSNGGSNANQVHSPPTVDSAGRIYIASGVLNVYNSIGVHLYNYSTVAQCNGFCPTIGPNNELYIFDNNHLHKII